MAMTRKDILLFQMARRPPRWEPGRLARAWFKGQDLKDAKANAEARRGDRRAEALNHATREMPASELPAPLEHTVSELIAELTATRKFRLEGDADQKGRRKRRLKKRTVDQYLITWPSSRMVRRHAGGRPQQKSIENWYDALIEVRAWRWPTPHARLPPGAELRQGRAGMGRPQPRRRRRLERRTAAASSGPPKRLPASCALPMR